MKKQFRALLSSDVVLLLLAVTFSVVHLLSLIFPLQFCHQFVPCSSAHSLAIVLCLKLHSFCPGYWKWQSSLNYRLLSSLNLGDLSFH